MCLTALLCRTLQEVMRNPVVLMADGCNKNKQPPSPAWQPATGCHPALKSCVRAWVVNHALRSLLGA